MLEIKTAKQAMSSALVTLQPEMDVLQALRILVERGRVIGFISRRDMLKCLEVAWQPDRQQI